MTPEEMKALVTAWISGSESMRDSAVEDRYWWAHKTVMDWAFESQHEFLWQFILEAYTREQSDEAFANLAAGPVEDLVSKFGHSYIDQIEALARRDNRFNHLLGGVWKSDTPEDIWERVERVRKAAW